jgi:hypothetical protein
MMPPEKALAWWNYHSNQTEYGPFPMTDDKALEYLPQIHAAQQIYRIRRQQGASIPDAMRHVLEITAGLAKKEES